MLYFIIELQERNSELFYFRLIIKLLQLSFIFLNGRSRIKVLGVNAWFKPFKFTFSTFLFSQVMGWYCFYLADFNANLFNRSIIVLSGFEILYISFQAGKVQLSHYNIITYCAPYCIHLWAQLRQQFLCIPALQVSWFSVNPFQIYQIIPFGPSE